MFSVCQSELWCRIWGMRVSNSILLAERKLGLERPYGADAVRRAFRLKAKAAHPDSGGSHRRFILLSEARDLLLLLCEEVGEVPAEELPLEEELPGFDMDPVSPFPSPRASPSTGLSVLRVVIDGGVHPASSRFTARFDSVRGVPCLVLRPPSALRLPAKVEVLVVEGGRSLDQGVLFSGRPEAIEFDSDHLVRVFGIPRS